MASVGSTISALQAHTHELQNYISEWTRKQQGLLQITTMQPALLETTNHMYLPAQSTDQGSIIDCSFFKVPTLTDENPDPTASAVAYAVHKEAVAAADEIVNERRSLVLSHAGMVSANQNANDARLVLSDAGMVSANQNASASNSIQTCRETLSTEFSRSLSVLKELKRKEDILSWLNDTLCKLEDGITNFDVLNMPAECEEPHSPSVTRKCTADSKHPLKPLGPRSWLRWLVQSKRFELTTATVIILNSIIMGISTDHAMHNLEGSESTPFLQAMERTFFIYYAIELTLRLLNFGRYFFFGDDHRWNWFDFVLVCMSFNDQIEPLYRKEGGSPALNLSFLRLVRLVKMAKLLRMIRLMKMFKQLRVMLAAITSSMHAVLWAALLVLITNYVASILFVSLCATFLKDAASENKDVDSDVRVAIEEYWGSVVEGMRSLLAATTGGQDWISVGAPLLEVGWAAYCLFLAYMGFFLIVILNTFASLFVQVVLEESADDREAVIAAELEKKDEYIAELQLFYDQIDDDGDGLITFEEFRKHAEDEKFQAWATHLEIDISDAKEFFEVLSASGRQFVDIETFVVGCIKLKGNAKSVDMMSVYQMTKKIDKTIDSCNLMLHMMKRGDASLADKIKEVAKMVNAAYFLQRDAAATPAAQPLPRNFVL